MNKTCWIRLHILPWKYPKKVGTRLFVLFTTKLVLKNGVILWSLNCTMLYAYGTCNLSQGADLETTAVYYFYNINGKENTRLQLLELKHLMWDGSVQDVSAPRRSFHPGFPRQLKCVAQGESRLCLCTFRFFGQYMKSRPAILNGSGLYLYFWWRPACRKSLPSPKIQTGSSEQARSSHLLSLKKAGRDVTLRPKTWIANRSTLADRRTSSSSIPPSPARVPRKQE